MTIMLQEINSAVASVGWWTGLYDGELMELAVALGRPVAARNDGPLVDTLHVNTVAMARPNSLSARHGTGSFPLHVDGSHHAIVPKYVILRLKSESPSQRGTVLVNFRDALSIEEDRLLREGLWIVRTGRRAFLAPVLDGPFLRYDQDIMTPKGAAARRAQDAISSVLGRTPHLIIRWTHHRTIVLDNHRVLHGREDAAHGEATTECRELERMLVRAHELEYQ